VLVVRSRTGLDIGFSQNSAWQNAAPLRGDRSLS
jgi:hypothetical protein